MELCIVLSGDVHPMSGTDSIPKKNISVRITGRCKKNLLYTVEIHLIVY